jgi:hypothetical protein
MKHILVTLLGIVLITVHPISAEVGIDGFLQGLYGGRLDKNNPTETEYTSSESRLQLRAEHIGDNAEFFSRLDFLYDGALGSEYDWELREAYLKFRLGNNLDFKVGRQILTWGTGDLIFINDVFAKDYRSFFVGRDDQYLKAPQTAFRAEYYHNLGNFTVVWTPSFEANRLPYGQKLSYFSPFGLGESGPGIIGTGLSEMAYFDPPTPEKSFRNSEWAVRFNRSLGGFSASLYFYRGFYKNPLGAEMVGMNGSDPVFIPVYPRLNVYGFSLRGMKFGGILWLEGGYFDSRDDTDGDNPLMPNSSITGLIGFEKQVATNLTVNAQWQADYMLDYETFETQQSSSGLFVRDELRHLFTSRITKLMYDELVNLSGFIFYSPSDEDFYIRLSIAYDYTDELTLAAGANIFGGEHTNTDFGQFQKNDNMYVKVTYGF